LLEPYGITERDVTERIQEWTATIAQSLSGSAVAFSQVTFKFFVQIGVMVYLLFFFFRDGPKLLHVLKEHLPLERAYGDRLLTRFAETTRAIIKGTLTVSILQGVIIGFTFWLTGITSPVLWGVAVAVLALIPALGAALVWVPAGLILLFTGSVWGGIVIFGVGAVLMTFVDEFLRPILVGRNAKLPDAIILLATLGGLSTFGISGFVIGPVVAAFFLTLWTIFQERFKA
ncbi:MAG: AI-2E family transporter, partial [Patescibacteria group bacterium]